MQEGDLVKALVINVDQRKKRLVLSLKPSHFEGDVNSSDEKEDKKKIKVLPVFFPSPLPQLQIFYREVVENHQSPISSEHALKKLRKLRTRTKERKKRTWRLRA